MRADLLLASQLGISRNRAQFLIEQGQIFLGDRFIVRSSEDLPPTSLLTKQEGSIYVARSAYKLLGAIDARSLDVRGWTCLDIGSSTGGWTQVLLERGAGRVVCVEIGSDQLHPSLRWDERIDLHERTDIAHFFTQATFDLIVADVSFAPLSQILPHIARLSTVETRALLLFKPQFEGIPLTKSGVPKSQSLVDAAWTTASWELKKSGWKLLDKSPAALSGEAWNQEYILDCVRRIEEV